MSKDPFELFGSWFNEALEKEKVKYPNAMCLSTVDEDGLPDARFVLLKEFDRNGFVFYTNTLSRKGLQLKRFPYAALTFYWDELMRQVRIRGKVEPLSDREADEYFRTRPYEHRISAWASNQSEILYSRELLERRFEYYRKLLRKDVPRPKYWSGYRLVPFEFEFWQGREFRLHDRWLYVKDGEAWKLLRLYP